jgi:cell division protein FtsL
MKDAVRRFKETVENRSVAITRGRWRRYVSLVTLVAMIIATACFHIWQRVEVLDLVQQTGTMQQRNALLVDEGRKLHSQIAQLSTPTRIQEYAADTIGMLPIAGERLFTLIPKETVDSVPPNEIELVMNSLRRVTDNLPGLSGSATTAHALDTIIFDTSALAGER